MRNKYQVLILAGICSVGMAQNETEPEFYQGPTKTGSASCISEEVLDSIVYESWDQTTQVFSSDEVRHYEYSDEGLNNRITYIDLEDRDTIGYDLYTYNEEGNFIIREEYERDVDDNLFLSLLNERVWDADGYPIEDVITFYDFLIPDEIRLIFKSVYEHDGSGNLNQYTTFIWDEVSEEWNPSLLYKIEYDADGNRLSQETIRWDPATLTFSIPNRRSEYTSNNGRLTSWTRFEYNDDLMDYALAQVFRYGYDASGFQTLFQFELPDENGDPIPSSKTEFTPTACENVSTANLFNYDADIEEWFFDARRTYYYSGGGVGVMDFNINELNAFPNPTTGIINLDLENNPSGQIQIFNGQGNQVISKLHPSNEEIDLSNLTSGIYFLRFNNGAEIHQSRIIKID